MEDALPNQNVKSTNSPTMEFVFPHAHPEPIQAMEDVLEAVLQVHSISVIGVTILAQLKPNISLKMLASPTVPQELPSSMVSVPLLYDTNL